MLSRRALIVAPLYDGKWLPPLPGRSLLIDRLTKCLKKYGGYEVKALDGLVEEDTLRTNLAQFFDTDGELLFYFYGHGCLRPPGLGVFAGSYARPNKEGILMAEITAFANHSLAREVVLLLDCCHAGAGAAASDAVIRNATGQLQAGRGLLAACASHQQGWTASNEEQKQLGVFSTFVLKGLEGGACPRGDNKVRTGILGNYVTEKFRLWGQTPFYQTHETGDRFCVITFDLPVSVQPEILQPCQKTLAIGIPFKPSQLFMGRSAELDNLRSTLIDGTKPIAVSATVEGLGGIGKTELILQLLHDPQITAAYNTILWLDGGGPLPPQWSSIATELEIKRPPKLPGQLLKRISTECRKRGNTLIILDNASEWLPVAEFIPVEFPLLVTTRAQDFGGTNFRHTELGFLPQDSAKDLLLQMAPALSCDPALDQLVENLGGHALAIELAGRNLRYLGLSATEYIERLSKNKKDSQQALATTKQGRTVEACLSSTWNGLRLNASRKLWRHAALFAPTSAHRDLLKVSFAGSEEIRRELSWFQRESQRKFAYLSAEEFDEAYAELRAFHILSRVEGANGERWAMHRLVRDYGRARLQSDELMMHAMAFSEWLRAPTLPLAPEIPHFVVAVLDSARYIGEFESMRGTRYLHDEISYRSGFFFNSKYFIDFLRTELRDPQALTIILAGLRDVNEDVRIQAIQLLENVGPIPEVLEGLALSLSAPEPSVRERAAHTLVNHGGRKTIEILLAAVNGLNTSSRLTAVRALGIMGTKAQNALLVALQSSDAVVRYNAAVFLADQGNKEGIAEIVAGLRANLPLVSEDLKISDESNTAHMIRAIRALSNVDTPEVYSLLFEVLKNPAQLVKTASSKAIMKLDIPDGPNAIVSELTLLPSKSIEESREFIEIALEAAAKSRIPLPLPLVTILLKMSDERIVTACVKSVGNAKVRASAPLLIDLALTTTTDSKIREASLQSLTDIGEIDALISLLTSEAASVRRKAAETLGLLKARNAVGALKHALTQKNSQKTRLSFVRALFLIGSIQAENALSAIMQTERDMMVRRAAMAAIVSIRSNSSWQGESAMFTVFEVGFHSSRSTFRENTAALLVWLNHKHAEKHTQGENCSLRRIITPAGQRANKGLDLARYLAVQRINDSIETKYETLYSLLLRIERALPQKEFASFRDSFLLNRTAHDTYKSYVRALLQVLTAYGLSIPVNSLNDLLNDQDPLTQQSATMAVAILRKSSGVSALIASTNSDKASTRWSAIIALEAIGGRRARAHLAKIAKNSRSDVERDAAKKALARHAKRGKSSA